MNATRPLPFYVEPAPGEALPSWLSRLARRLGVSVPALIEHLLGVKISARQPQCGNACILGTSHASRSSPE